MKKETDFGFMVAFGNGQRGLLPRAALIDAYLKDCWVDIFPWRREEEMKKRHKNEEISSCNLCTDSIYSNKKMNIKLS